MAHGGKRAGAGRPKGSTAPLKGMARKKVMKALDSDTSPLDYILGVIKDPETYNDKRFQAAKEALPYVHPRLTAVAHQHSREADVFQIITNVERVEEKISENLNEGKTLELSAETVKDGDSYH